LFFVFSTSPSPSLGMEKLLEEYKDIFQDPSKGHAPLKGIKQHQIDLILGVSLPNKA